MPRKKKLDLTSLEFPLAKGEQIMQVPIAQVVTNSYCEIGNYVNCHRHLADLDGFKVSYRRLIYTALAHFPHTSFSHTNTVISKVSDIHPHNILSLNEVCATLAKSGIFEMEGSMGYTQIDGVVNTPANERYTYVKISNLYWEILGDLIKEVPFVESPNANLEPLFLPLPLPSGLSMRALSQGLGFGISMIYPNFSPMSLYKAMLKDDPNLLEPNVDLILDKKNSELKKLWETGQGKVIYAYKISRYTNPETKMEGILFETKDGTEIFTPKLKPLRKLEEAGKVYIEDLTDYNSCKMVVYRVPGARGITIEDIEKLCRKCCFNNTTYNINVTNGSTAFRIPLREWIKFTYDRFLKICAQSNKRKIEKTQFDIAVWEAIPIVGEYILNNPRATDKEIQKALGMPEEIVNTVLGKPISYLRKNSDTTGKVKELKAKLKELKKFDPIVYTEEIIKRL